MPLYLISTPIGNREDISLRAIKQLFALDILYCEDTHKTKRLMDYYLNQYKDLIHTDKIPRFLSYFEYNEDKRIPEIESNLKQNLNIGIVSNGGTPTISDPGYRLIKACRESDLPVYTLPGSNAAVAALSISGLPTDKYIFLGFLPRKIGKQTKIFKALDDLDLSATIIIYESPYRLKKTLQNLQQVFGNQSVIIARE